MGNSTFQAQQTGASPMGGAPQPLPPVSAVQQMGEPPGAYQQMPQHQMMMGLNRMPMQGALPNQMGNQAQAMPMQGGLSLFGGNPGAYGVPGQNFGQQGMKPGGQAPQYGQGKMGGYAPQYGGQKMGGYAPQYGAQSKIGNYAPQFGGQGKAGGLGMQGGPTQNYNNYNQQMAAQALMGRTPPAPTMGA